MSDSRGGGSGAGERCWGGSEEREEVLEGEVGEDIKWKVKI